jgi:ribosomal protein S18 acetylase RimI-like enzyme
MNYLSIDHITDPHLSFVEQLYMTAFPPKERREWQVLAGMIGKVPEMHMQVILDRDQPIGFITSWKLSDWCFIEHFAIAPESRGQKFGEEVILDFLKGYKVILEVEPPVSEDALRRIRFYEHAGMECLPIPYLQPSYRVGAEPYQMVLMSNVINAPEPAYTKVLKLISGKVYHSALRIE